MWQQDEVIHLGTGFSSSAVNLKIVCQQYESKLLNFKYSPTVFTQTSLLSCSI